MMDERTYELLIGGIVEAIDDGHSMDFMIHNYIVRHAAETGLTPSLDDIRALLKHLVDGGALAVSAQRYSRA